MNTARIVVLAIAAGAIGATACPARGADSNGRPAARLPDGPRANDSLPSPEPRRFISPDIIQSSAHDGRTFRRGQDIQVATQT
jgi:hypothetical protein